MITSLPVKFFERSKNMGRNSLGALMGLYDNIPETKYFNVINDVWDKILGEMYISEGICGEVKEGNYTISVDVPGFKKDEIQLNYENGVLSLKGETKDKKRTIERLLNLPVYVSDEEMPIANLEDGILTVTFKLLNEENKNKKIEIK